MTVAELIAALQKLPGEAQVYVHEAADDYNVQGYERDPHLSFDDAKDTYRSGKLAYPHGRVQL